MPDTHTLYVASQHTETPNLVRVWERYDLAKGFIEGGIAIFSGKYVKSVSLVQGRVVVELLNGDVICFGTNKEVDIVMKH